MRDPAVPIVYEMPPEKSEQQVKLDWLQAEHPELYKQAKVFALRFDRSEAEKVVLMVTFIEDALVKEVRLLRNEQLLDEYHEAKRTAA